MRLHACLAPSFWQDAVETSLHLYNRQPMRRHTWKTPIELFNGDKPDASYFRIFGIRAYVFIPPEQRQNKLSSKAEEMIFIGYEPNTKGYCFWLKTRHSVFISTNAVFDENMFPYCSKDQEDRPTPIPIEDEPLEAADNLSDHEDTQRNLDPPRDVYLQLPLGLGQPPNPLDPPDDGQSFGSAENPWRHSSWRPHSTSSSPWRPSSLRPTGEEEHIPSPLPLFESSGEESTHPPSYHSSPMRPATKRTQPETGHRSSISDKHHHKRYSLDQSAPPHRHRRLLLGDPIVDSSPSEQEPDVEPDADTRDSGTRSWLPPRQQPDETYPEFRARPHQHRPTIDDRSQFRIPAAQRQSSRVPIPRIRPDNAYGDRRPIEIERDIQQGLPMITEEPSLMDETTPTNEEEDLGQIYSSKWIRHHLSMAVESSQGYLPKLYRDVIKLPIEEQTPWRNAMQEEIKSMHERKVWDLSTY